MHRAKQLCKLSFVHFLFLCMHSKCLLLCNKDGVVCVAVCETSKTSSVIIIYLSFLAKLISD